MQRFTHVVFVNLAHYRGVRHERNLVHRPQKSKLKPRNPLWNPEVLKPRNLLWNPETHSDIQKSTLKSGNPIQDSTSPQISVYFYYLYYTTRRARPPLLWRNRISPQSSAGTKVILLRYGKAGEGLDHVSDVRGREKGREDLIERRRIIDVLTHVVD